MHTPIETWLPHRLPFGGRAATREPRPNASYFAFTATPKAITLEKFGVRQPDGTFAPFHLYSMRQAIEEGFILDVLANYTTYRSYYEVAKAIAENPDFEVASAQRRLRRHVEEHPDTIAAKAEIMVDHFLDRVVRPKRLKDHGRCLIVTKNITAAIRYYRAVGHVLRKRNSAVQALVAFSGKKVVDGIEHTEASLNWPGVGELRRAFDADPYRILVVANKFLTGFDQPKLCGHVRR